MAANDAFSRARKTYVELLTAKERTQVEAPITLSDLLSEAQAICKTFEISRKTTPTPFSRRLGSAALKLQPFERVLEGVVKLSPQAGQLIWGSVSFIFEMARNNVEVFDETMGFFLAMADEMEYVQLLETTFKNVPLVELVIESLYAAILDFWVKAVKYYRPKPSKRARIASLVSSGYMLQKFQNLKAEILTQKDRLHRVTSAQHYADTASDSHRRREDAETSRRKTLVTWINAPSYESDFHSAQKRYYAGTCDWIQKRTEYSEWVSGKANPLLVIYGIPGAGKTILSSWLISQARSRATEIEDIVLYHFFKASDDSKNTPLAAMRSLINQLYEHLRQKHDPLISELEESLDALSTKNLVSFMHLWGAFSSLVSRFHQSPSSARPMFTIVLDAMDECRGSKPFVRELHKQVHAGLGMIRVIVTSRKSGDHVDEFARIPLDHLVILEITKDNVKHDIASFARYKISKIERLQGEQHTNLRNSVIAELGKVENHQGMFLWTYLMCKEVKHILQVPAIWRLLKNLPKGLDAMYARICNRLAENEQQRDFGCTVLQWIVASSRPLRFGELEQALKTMQEKVKGGDAGGFFADGSMFDEEYGLGLLWSRKDIVEACGDLVTYSGLDDGDMISLVHLSARHFLCSDPSRLSLPPDLLPSLPNISFFLVNIPRAEAQLGATCLEYLLGNSLHSDPHFKRPVGSKVDRPSRQQLTKQHPLFAYSTIYWAEYVLNVLSLSSGVVDINVLVSRALLFIAHPFSVVWLEEYIHQYGIETTGYIIRRFSELPPYSAFSELICWAENVGEVLRIFSKTLPVYPSAIRTCLPKLGSPSSRNKFQPHYQNLLKSELDIKHINEKPLSAFPCLEKIHRSWLHYDSITDSLLSVDTASEALCLKRQVLTPGIRLRPALFDSPEVDNGIVFFAKSAAVSARTGFVAITFASTSKGIRRYTTVCWSLITSGAFIRPSEWAEVAFVDRLEGPAIDKFESTYEGFDKFQGSVVAFGADNTLIAPGGIWDTLSEERKDGPDAIFNPDPELAVRSTCFSGNGKRVARITSRTGNDVLEVLDIRGHLLGTIELSSKPTDLFLIGFSGSGNKVIFRQRPALQTSNFQSSSANKSTYRCYDTSSAACIEIPIPQNTGDIHRLIFTKDEDRLIAWIDALYLKAEPSAEPIRQRLGSSIAVWTFAKDDHGRYLSHASLTYLFKSYDNAMEFCLARLPSAPMSHPLHDSLMVVTGDGVVHLRHLSTEWSPQEEQDLLASYNTLFPESRSRGIFCDTVVLRKGGALELFASFRDSHYQNPSLANWSLRQRSMQLIKTIPAPTLKMIGRLSFTLTGSFLFDIDNQEFYKTLGSDASELMFSILQLPLASDTILGCAFSSADTRVAFLHATEEKHILSVFDIIEGNIVGSPLISVDIHTIRDQLGMKGEESFSAQDYDASCSRLSFCDAIPNLLAVSYCTNWDETLGFTFLLTVVDQDIEVSKISDKLRKSIMNPEQHPIMMRTESNIRHVSSPYVFELEIDNHTGALFLDRRRIGQVDDESYESRLICILPDDVAIQRSTLVWPPDSDDKFGTVILVLPQGLNEPVVIDTDLASSDMMKPEYWFSKSGRS
ncbi:hypothetical protein H0H92_010561 [Tricholoma furcatifolium]|nr:hypothetical protein H0H92_010561 [Tricholoma furcatifolium]